MDKTGESKNPFPFKSVVNGHITISLIFAALEFLIVAVVTAFVPMLRIELLPFFISLIGYSLVAALLHALLLRYYAIRMHVDDPHSLSKLILDSVITVVVVMISMYFAHQPLLTYLFICAVVIVVDVAWNIGEYRLPPTNDDEIREKSRELVQMTYDEFAPEVQKVAEDRVRENHHNPAD